VSKPSPDEAKLEAAASYALGALPSDEKEAFEADLADAPELRDEVAELRVVVDELALAPPPVAPRAEARAHLLERVASEGARPADGGLPAFYFARAHEFPWKEISPGVEIKLLTPGVPVGGRALVLRVAAGASVAVHEHRVAEHCFVLSGDVVVAGETLGPGDYHLAAAGTTHRKFTSEGGCLVLVVDGPAA
jgi:anti-sigma factor ChrR (cupin superfamily)